MRHELHAEFLAVMQQAAMVIGNAPRAGIEIETLVEGDLLGDAAHFGIGVAATQRPVPSAGPVVIFQHLHLVAGFAQFIRCGHARKARAQHQHRGAFHIARQFDRVVEVRCSRIAHRHHGFVHHGAARRGADQFQKRAAADGIFVVIFHGLLSLTTQRYYAGTGNFGKLQRRTIWPHLARAYPLCGAFSQAILQRVNLKMPD
jgi:hypothetical protein